MLKIVITEYTIVRVTPNEDGEIVSVVIVDEIGPLVCLFGAVSPDRPIYGQEYQFRRVTMDKNPVLESVRISRLLAVALAAVNKKSLLATDIDMDDPRYILGVDAGFYPYLL